MDAGSLEFIASATAEGRLPNFGRILDAGAVMHLATLHPTSAEAVWTAVATGKLPQKNGVRSAAFYRLARRPGGAAMQLLPDFCFATGLVALRVPGEERADLGVVRAAPLWSILSGAGVSVGVVNLPLTYPAPEVRGLHRQRRGPRLAPRHADLRDPRPVSAGSAGRGAGQALGVDGRRGSGGPGGASPSGISAPARADRAYESLHGR